MYLEEDAVKKNDSSKKGSGKDDASKSMYFSKKPVVFEFFLLKIYINTYKVQLIFNYTDKIDCIYNIIDKAAMRQALNPKQYHANDTNQDTYYFFQSHLKIIRTIADIS